MLRYNNRKTFATSRTTYLDTFAGSPESRIYIPVQFGHLPPTFAIVDTGAPWCILNKEQAEQINPNYQSEAIETKALTIRGWEVEGVLVRLPIKLCAEKGIDITIEGTVFIPNSESELPNFIGLNGLLNRIKFAVDPQNNIFFFGTEQGLS